MSKPTFTDVIAGKDNKEIKSLPKKLEWTVETATNSILHEIYGPLKDDKEAYALLVSDRDFAFKITRQAFDKYQKINLSELAN